MLERVPALFSLSACCRYGDNDVAKESLVWRQTAIAVYDWRFAIRQHREGQYIGCLVNGAVEFIQAAHAAVAAKQKTNLRP